METARYRSHLSRIFIIQTILSIFLATWYGTLGDAASTTTPPPAFPGQTCNGLHNNSCVENAFCNNTSCQCSQTFYNLNNACVSKASFNQNCNETRVCLDLNPEYNNNTCECKKAVLNESCSNTQSCMDPHAECYKGFCHYHKVALNESCSGSNTCLDPHAECKGGVCVCWSDYYNNNGMCSVKAALNESCSGSNTCLDPHAECKGGVCVCWSDYYNNNGNCSVKAALNESCSGSKTCLDPHAECRGGVCVCWSDYYNNNGNCSVKVALNQSCSGSNTCLDPHAECKGGVCVCWSDYYNNNGMCSVKVALNQSCSGSNTCLDPHAECKGGVCVCSNYYYNNNGMCSVKAALNESCSGSKPCLDPHAECKGGVCVCSRDYYNNNGMCSVKAALNESCIGSKPCLDPHAECKGGVCVCLSDYYNNNGMCSVRLGYGEVCVPAVANMCNQLLTCRSATNRCLCPNGSFRYNNTCYSVEQLKITEIKSTFEETSLNLTWKPPNLGGNFIYTVSLNNVSSKVVNVSSTRVEGLAPGTLYTASVVTSVVRDPDYSSTEMESSPDVSNSFYTKPAMPGPLSTSVYLGPDVNLTFTKSVGGVAFYIVYVTQQESSRLWTKNISSPSDPVHVTLLNQTAGAYYDVTIVAYIGGISSNTRTATYRVEVDVAGEVTELTVTLLGSRWANVRWRRPTNPNEEILGYTVEVTPLNNSTCVSGVAVLCSNCNGMTSTSLKMPDVSNCTKSDTKKQTHEELKSNVTWQEVNVTSLSPYVSYQVTVTAVNEKGRGQENKKQFKTQSEVADNLVSLTVEEPLTVGELNITWVPGERRGNTSYNVTWFEQSSIDSEQFTYKSGSILYGYTQNTYTIHGLLSYWKYLVGVRPSTEIGLSPDENYTFARTLDSAPGEVEIFTINQPPDSATYLQFTVSCPKEKERNGVIIYFAFRTSVPANETLGSVSVTRGCNENYTFNASVKAETNYTFEAFANTSRNEGISKTSKFYVAPRAPTLSVDPNFGGSLLKDVSDVTQTTAVINICPCLVNDRSQGNITLAGLIVCKGNCETLRSDANHFRSGIMTWKQFQENGYVGSYRPTPDDWHETQHVVLSRKKRSTFLSRSIRETLKEIKFTLGGDADCEQKNKSVYCNGPLPPGNTFGVKVFACTAGGCKEADTGIIITLGEEPVATLGAIIGGVLGALAALVIVVLIIVFVKRRRRRPTEKIQRYVPSIERLRRRSTKLRDFKSRLALLHRDSNLHFREEFEELCSSQERQALQFTMRAGNEPVNRFKNRSQEVPPYDHSRVVLINSQDSSQDYINASYIAGTDSPCEFIATQAPLYSTLSDFWRMVYEHRTGVIVMLCDSVENGKKMVDPYWPDEINVPVRHGDLTVTMTGVSVLDVYTVRKIKVTMKERQDLRVTQLYIRGWSERGCNLPVEKLIDIIRVVGRETTKSSGPVTVHCNLGVGRTGMFIALDLLTRFVDNHSLNHEVNVYDVVQRMMGCRSNIIQTLTQYMFIHDVLGVIIGKKTQNGSRGATPSVVYQNEGHTVNEYSELYEHIRDENVYSALNEHQMK